MKESGAKKVHWMYGIIFDQDLDTQHKRDFMQHFAMHKSVLKEMFVFGREELKQCRTSMIVNVKNQEPFSLGIVKNFDNFKAITQSKPILEGAAQDLLNQNLRNIGHFKIKDAEKRLQSFREADELHTSDKEVLAELSKTIDMYSYLDIKQIPIYKELVKQVAYGLEASSGTVSD